MPSPLRRLRARRYVAPLREGGSLPAAVETDGGLFAVKFRGAGQGARALVAEIIVGRLAVALGLPIPEVALVHLDDGFGRAEPDPEIQDILRGSHGTNVGLAWVDGAFPYDPVACEGLVGADIATDIVWLDALVTNVDRTPRNPNLLVTGAAEGARLHLMDHGAALYFHHNWPSLTPERATASFNAITDHVLLPIASQIETRDPLLAARLPAALVHDAVAAVPDDLLMDAPPGRTPPFDTPEANREAYVAYLVGRLADRGAWVGHAASAHEDALGASRAPLPYRR